ncbi:uL30 family ribosomal protein [Candidatus Woesearchaeota archaeon]|nr:uL30 family ribosomal protein [Candidatus Woesearchaeota archaeon]
MKSGKQFAVIRLRGRTGIRADVEDTLTHLNLQRINNCVIVGESPVILGMLRKAKDYVTWGQIDAETLRLLVEKRGESAASSGANANGKTAGFNGKIYKRYFRLGPPKGGLGRRGIKAAFSKSGALGSRGEKINDLIKRMI